MDKRFHTDTRLSENFTENGLVKLTGENTFNWLKYLTKELIDNSLEACKTPAIEVIALTRGYNDGRITDIPQKLFIKDNGPGISEEMIYQIFRDVDRFGGTKRHYKLLTRGNQGNALMTVLGIQNLFGSPLRLQSNSDIYIVKVVENDLTGNPEVKIEKTVADKNISGLWIDLDFTNNEVYIGSIYDDVCQVMLRFIELNPQACFRLHVKDLNPDFSDLNWFSSNGIKGNNNLNLGEKVTTGKVIWFSEAEFSNRLKADVRIDAQIKLRDFISEFYGLSSAKKVSNVIDDFGLGNFEYIGDFFDNNGHTNKQTIRQLYHAMCQNTTKFSKRGLNKTLGCIGQEGMKHALIESIKLENRSAGVAVSNFPWSIEKIVEASKRKNLSVENIDDLIVYYSKGGMTESFSKIIPHYFELIAIPLDREKVSNVWGENHTDLTFGINQSFIYSVPEIHLMFKKRSNSNEASYSSIRSAFNDLDFKFKVVCNLMCPTIDFRDKGKQLFDTEPFAEIINEVIGLTVRKITNEIIPVLNKLNESNDSNEEIELTNKAPKGFIKDFIFANFEAVYNKATDEGRYTITQRQFYYAMRPVFLATARAYGYEWTYDSSLYQRKRLELDYNTFCSYVADYEVNVLGERIIYKKDRGFFVEPHSGRHLNLGTEAVKRYYPDLEQYNHLLFVEKSGFYELLHKDFELTKRYDIGLINAEGYANNAMRDLIEKIQQAKPDIKLYVLTDFDIDGLGIAKNVKKADELSAIEAFECKRLGISLEDVKGYNLPPEAVDYAKNKLTELENRYQAGEISDNVYEFLKAGQRVEINAFSPVELKEYLERKFQEAGIEKLKPESEAEIDVFETRKVNDIRKDALKEAIADFVSEQCDDIIMNFLDAKAKLEAKGKKTEEKFIKLTDNQAKTIYDEIIEELKEFPPKNWYELNKDKKDKIRNEAESVEKKYKAAIKAQAEELLSETVCHGLNTKQRRK